MQPALRVHPYGDGVVRIIQEEKSGFDGSRQSGIDHVGKYRPLASQTTLTSSTRWVVTKCAVWWFGTGLALGGTATPGDAMLQLPEGVQLCGNPSVWRWQPSDLIGTKEPVLAKVAIALSQLRFHNTERVLATSVGPWVANKKFWRGDLAVSGQPRTTRDEYNQLEPPRWTLCLD